MAFFTCAFTTALLTAFFTFAFTTALLTAFFTTAFLTAFFTFAFTTALLTAFFTFAFTTAFLTAFLTAFFAIAFFATFLTAAFFAAFLMGFFAAAFLTAFFAGEDFLAGFLDALAIVVLVFRICYVLTLGYENMKIIFEKMAALQKNFSLIFTTPGFIQKGAYLSSDLPNRAAYMLYRDARIFRIRRAYLMGVG